MTKDKASRLAALFFLELILLNFPIVGLFNEAVLLGGIPLLYWYLVVIWLVGIAGTAWILERPAKPPNRTEGSNSTSL